jgi:hypothetical protein
MATVTETRISQQVQDLARREETIYHKYFPAGGADGTLWETALRSESVLGGSLLKRPIGIMQIKTACKRYIREFEEACIAAKAREQARAADQKSRETPA